MLTFRATALLCTALTVAACSLAGLADPLGAASSSSGGSADGGDMDASSADAAVDAGLILVAADAGLIGKYVIGLDPRASTGKYVFIPEGQGCSAGADGTSLIVFDFTVGAAGTFEIVARFYAPDIAHESFFVSTDITPGYAALFRADELMVWEEQPVYDDSAEVKSPIQYAWDAGMHQVVFECRSDATELDRIAIVPVP